MYTARTPTMNRWLGLLICFAVVCSTILLLGSARPVSVCRPAAAAQSVTARSSPATPNLTSHAKVGSLGARQSAAPNQHGSVDFETWSSTISTCDPIAPVGRITSPSSEDYVNTCPLTIPAEAQIDRTGFMLSAPKEMPVNIQPARSLVRTYPMRGNIRGWIEFDRN